MKLLLQDHINTGHLILAPIIITIVFTMFNYYAVYSVVTSDLTFGLAGKFYLDF